MRDILLYLKYVTFSQKQTVQHNLIYADKKKLPFYNKSSYCIEQGVSFYQ